MGRSLYLPALRSSEVECGRGDQGIPGGPDEGPAGEGGAVEEPGEGRRQRLAAVHRGRTHGQERWVRRSTLDNACTRHVPLNHTF